jgi:monofunctional biosynthetic peptidoglycan transglycosylase
MPFFMWKWFKKILFILFISQLVYIVLLKWVDPPLTITQVSSVLSGYGLKRDMVDEKHISPHARLAVVAAEDQLFPDHNGFDIKSIETALADNQKKPGRRVRGASTISQQVAKNVFLWQGRSWIRKGLEVYFTFMIELIWGKKRILEVYLNVVEMGTGIFGIQAAAQAYFNKPASKLTAQEASLVAAILPNPKKYRIDPPTRYMGARSRWIRRQMNNLKDDPDVAELVFLKN